jgi:hypothetical protein
MFLEESSRPTITVVLKLFPNALYFFRNKSHKNFTTEILMMIDIKIKNWLFTTSPSLKTPKYEK